MFGIGSTEFLVIIVVAVLVLGPEHLPKVMRTFSKVMSEFRKVSTDFQRAVNLEAVAEEQKKANPAPKKKKKKTVAETASATADTGLSTTPAATPVQTETQEAETRLSPLEELALLNEKQQEDAIAAHRDCDTDAPVTDSTPVATAEPSEQSSSTAGKTTSQGPAV